MMYNTDFDSGLDQLLHPLQNASANGTRRPQLAHRWLGLDDVKSEVPAPATFRILAESLEHSSPKYSGPHSSDLTILLVQLCSPLFRKPMFTGLNISGLFASNWVRFGLILPAMVLSYLILPGLSSIGLDISSCVL